MTSLSLALPLIQSRSDLIFKPLKKILINIDVSNQSNLLDVKICLFQE
jgi:hypothetical protein